MGVPELLIAFFGAIALWLLGYRAGRADEARSRGRVSPESGTTSGD